MSSLATFWKRFKQRPLGVFALCVILVFILVGIYAPLLASSRPLFLIYEGKPYFPLFYSLFYSGFYTKPLDLFFNLMMFTLPLTLSALWFFKRKGVVIGFFIGLQCLIFSLLLKFPLKDPFSDRALHQKRQEAVQKKGELSFEEELSFMTPYGKVLLLVKKKQRDLQHLRLLPFSEAYREKNGDEMPTLFNLERSRLKTPYLEDKNKWIESQKMEWVIFPLIRDFHWEEDAGGGAFLNQIVPFNELTRINRKDLMASLIFGVRVSLVVGVMAVLMALLIGIPVGALSGYYGGVFDIVTSRLLEIWEAMPTFFMLLFIVAITQSKSIFLVILVIGIFGWTGFSRSIRAEFLKQRHLSYVEALKALGFNDRRIIFKHILPNAIPPLLTLLPFAVMGAMTSEAGLSFLGLGEEGSTSWGVLMDEGRQAFPAESYLLWPPAILLVILLTAIALVGDSLRDTLDPKAS
jgi:peptide/nickel transport system permease protein